MRRAGVTGKDGAFLGAQHHHKVRYDEDEDIDDDEDDDEDGDIDVVDEAS